MRPSRRRRHSAALSVSKVSQARRVGGNLRILITSCSCTEYRICFRMTQTSPTTSQSNFQASKLRLSGSCHFLRITLLGGKGGGSRSLSQGCLPHHALRALVITEK